MVFKCGCYGILRPESDRSLAISRQTGSTTVPDPVSCPLAMPTSTVLAVCRQDIRIFHAASMPRFPERVPHPCPVRNQPGGYRNVLPRKINPAV